MAYNIHGSLTETFRPSIKNKIFLSNEEVTAAFRPNNSLTLKCLHLNIQGIRANFDQLTIFLKDIDVNLDIIILTETQQSTNNPYCIPGFNQYFIPCKNSTYDSLMIYTNSRLKNVTIKKIEPVYLVNGAIIDIVQNKETYKILALYRSPSTSIKLFNDELETLLQILHSARHQILIGDININILLNDVNHPLTVDQLNYLNILYSKGFESHINSPTRETLSTQTCIDHVFIKTPSSVSSLISGVAHTRISDHYPILFGWLNEAKLTKTEAKTQQIKRINYEALKLALENESWDGTFTENVNNATENFMTTLLNHIESHTTIKTTACQHKLKKLSPWITNGILNSIKTRDKLFNKIKKHKSYCALNNIPLNKDFIDSYKLYRNLTNTLIKKCKQNYYRNKISQTASSSKELWRTINEITGRKKIETSSIEILQDGEDKIQDPKQIADTMGKYFTNIGIDLKNKIEIEISNPNSDKTFQPHNEPNAPILNNFGYVDSKEIMTYIDELNQSSSGGHDGITAVTVKTIKHQIIQPLHFIFNLSMSTGIFPNYFKVAIISPIHKTGEKTNPENYRPISLTTHLSKLLEKCIKNRLMDYVTKNKLLSTHQFGFQSKLGTQDAIADLTTFVTESLDKSYKPIAIFLDLKKAFDTVDHKILIQKLKKIGICHMAVELLESFLSKREQKVKIKNIYSKAYEVRIGVPQGTVLGPILFLLYINELCNLGPQVNAKIISFADDTVLLISEKSWELAFRKANIVLRTVADCLYKSYLTLNEKKTVYMTFSHNQCGQPQNTNPFTIKIHTKTCMCNDDLCNCPQVKNVHMYKYLGIVVDHHLKWNYQSNELRVRLQSLIYIFYRLKKILTIHILKIIYTALVQSILSYGIIGWGCLLKTHLSALSITQKYILKVILTKPKDFPTDTLFTIANVLDIRQLYIKSVLIYIFNHKQKFTPLSQSYTHAMHIPLTRQQTNHNLTIPRKRTQLGQRHFNYIGPRTFNTLDHMTKTSTSLHIYKRRIKNWIQTKERSYFENILSLVRVP